MLYVPVEVNGHPLKAFVDSGAQQTIITPECAEACGIMRLLDRRFAGVAVGVGTARIIGRIHSAQLKLGSDLYLPCSFTVMEGREVDLLFGLDMLKAHQACIDLEKNVLRIQGREVSFLAEHELPEKARNPSASLHPELSSPSSPTASGSGSSAEPAQSFPGAGHTLGATPAPVGAVGRGPAGPVAPVTENYPEEAVQTLMGLGATRELAIQTLAAAGGNLEVAASLLF